MNTINRQRFYDSKRVAIVTQKIGEEVLQFEMRVNHECEEVDRGGGNVIGISFFQYGTNREMARAYIIYSPGRK